MNQVSASPFFGHSIKLVLFQPQKAKPNNDNDISIIVQDNVTELVTGAHRKKSKKMLVCWVKLSDTKRQMLYIPLI